MRNWNLRAAAFLCAAAGALFVACTAPDGADNTSARRPATNTANTASTTNAANTASATATPNVAGPPYTNRPAERREHSHAEDTRGVRRVSIAELRTLLAGGQAVVVDVRAPESYRQGHIKGALSIPHDEVTARASELPKDKLIVFYCA